MLQVTVSDTGCLERAEVWQSSGVPELDQAALKWTSEGVTFLPAEERSEGGGRDGQGARQIHPALSRGGSSIRRRALQRTYSPLEALKAQFAGRSSRDQGATTSG
jgi:TonB family protein